MKAEQKFAAYLKNKPAFMPLLEALKTRWNHSGTWRGKLVLHECDPSLQEALAELLGGSFWGQSTITLTYGQWKKALSRPRFDSCDLQEVLSLVFDEPLEGQNIQKQKRRMQEQARFDEMTRQLAGTPAGRWLEEIRQARGSLYTRCCAESEAVLRQWAEAMNQLPMRTQEVSLIAVYAARVLHDPHALDTGPVRRLLIQSLRWELSDDSPNEEKVWEESELLEQAGLLRDQVSNRCLVYNLNGIGNRGEVHPGWQGFAEQAEPFSVTLSNVLNVERIESAAQFVIIENPSIFERLSAELRHQKRSDISLMCSEGQPNQCVWQLLRRVDKTNTQMWYCGDFDPEGLQMAQRMLRRCPGLKLWHYEVQDYVKALSNKSFNARRRRILESCGCGELAAIQRRMLQDQRCGYQEKLLEDYLKFDFQ